MIKKVLLGIGAVVAVAVVGVLGAAAMQPDVVHVERSLVMAAQPGDVHPHINDLKKFSAWNPWGQMDPLQKVTHSEPSAGLGARYDWSSELVGTGSMTITKSEPEAVHMRLVFTAPWQSEADANFLLKPEGDQTKVTWTYDQQADFGTKLMGLAMNMDSMLGPDYEKGLASLKVIAEEAATARKAAEAQAAADAKTAAEAEAAAQAAAPVEGAEAPPAAEEAPAGKAGKGKGGKAKKG
ncbi:MAG: SRPBCC family protein [Deltaproteobacteria bacterium]|nr:SRPBCC family protein [Deltaproteobacteria bacterium]